MKNQKKVIKIGSSVAALLKVVTDHDKVAGLKLRKVITGGLISVEMLDTDCVVLNLSGLFRWAHSVSGCDYWSSIHKSLLARKS